MVVSTWHEVEESTDVLPSPPWLTPKRQKTCTAKAGLGGLLEESMNTLAL